MPAYFVTWDKDDWPYEKLLPIVEKFKKYGHVENRWSCGSTKKIQLNDRIFLIKRGKGRRGIFGSGNVTKVPFLDSHYNSEEAEKGKECLFINLPCWFKTSAFRPKGAPRNKRSDVALSGADWGGDADPFPIFGFIPAGCFLIAQY